MSSREIAELTEKQHKHVLADIRIQLFTGLYGYDFDGRKNGYPLIQGLTASQVERADLIQGVDFVKFAEKGKSDSTSCNAKS